MLNLESRQRQDIIEKLQASHRDLVKVSEAIKSIKTVKEKLELFDQRDQIIEQQQQLQMELAVFDQKIANDIERERSQPIFMPAARPRS
jgi:hypothetical protein